MSAEFVICFRWESQMPDLNTEKPCSTCGVVKSLDDFSFDRRRKDGRQARCRECVKDYQKIWRRADREHYLALRKAEYERSEATRRAYLETHHDELLRKGRERYHQRIATETAEERETRLAAHRQRSKKYADENRDAVNARIRAWDEKNPEKKIDYTQRRRARIRGNRVGEVFTRTEIGERDDWVCGICGGFVDKTLRLPDRKSPSLDHIIPVSLGGEHSRANCRISHLICNQRRGIGKYEERHVGE